MGGSMVRSKLELFISVLKSIKRVCVRQINCSAEVANDAPVVLELNIK